MFLLKEKTTINDIIELKNNSAFTFEGLKLEPDEPEELYRRLKEEFNVVNDKEIEIYQFTGEDLRKAYPDIDPNYPNDRYLVAIPLEAFNNLGKAAMVKLTVGARWLDDIVDNLSR